MPASPRKATAANWVSRRLSLTRSSIPSAAHRRSRWPLDRTAELAEALRREHNLWTIVVGGPETRGKLGTAPRNTIDATGAITISELIAVIEEPGSSFPPTAGRSTSPAHSRPLVGLFRARRPEHAGRYPQAKVVFGQEPSCPQRCEWNRCQSLPCRQMNSLSVGEILDGIGNAI